MKHRAAVWIVAVIFSVLVVVSTIGSVSYFVNQARVQEHRRYDNCVSRQNLYDGQIVTVKFIGEKLRATPEEIKAGLADLREVLGPRPQCGSREEP